MTERAICCARCLERTPAAVAHTTVHANQVVRVCPACADWIAECHLRSAGLCDDVYMQPNLLLDGDLIPWQN